MSVFVSSRRSWPYLALTLALFGLLAATCLSSREVELPAARAWA